MSITVSVAYENPALLCHGESHLNVLWPETTPGMDSLQTCPENYKGIARRTCSLRDGHKSIWQLPDYSNCIHNSLIEVTENVSTL